MATVCAAVVPVDLLAPAKSWDTPPCSDISSRGSDISSEDSPSNKSTHDQQTYFTPCQPEAQDRPDKFPSGCDDAGFDLRLATRLVEIMGVKVRLSLAHALGERFGAKPREVDRAVRLLFRCFRLLHRCGYPREDIEVMVASASAYMRDVMKGMDQDGQPQMGLAETVHILCVLIYVAHSYCEDQNCPLHVWHQYLFRRYCTLRTLNAAVVGLLGRLKFRLRVEEEDLDARLTFLREGGEVPTSAGSGGA